MDVSAGCFWVAVAVGVLPLLWWWNDYRYALPFRICRGGPKLPPGYMGLPFLGETLAFLWYFKFLRCPDDFINSKRRKWKLVNPNVELMYLRHHKPARDVEIDFTAI